jgi:hypothetical protein
MVHKKEQQRETMRAMSLGYHWVGSLADSTAQKTAIKMEWQ